MTEVKKTKMTELLTRDNLQIRTDGAEHISIDLKEAHVSLILVKRAELRKLEAQKAAMTDISAIKDIDANEFVTRYQKFCESIANKTLLYNIAVETGKDLYDIDVEKI